MAQNQLFTGGGSPEDDSENSFGIGAGGGQIQINPLDQLLDEIDVVLEQNAETFVQGFVQKGGQ